MEYDVTIFYKSDVSNDNLGHRNLNDLTGTDYVKLLLLFDATLQPAELLLFAPVIERCDKHHADDRQQDGRTLNPARLCLSFIFSSTSRPTTICTNNTAVLELVKIVLNYFFIIIFILG